MTTSGPRTAEIVCPHVRTHLFRKQTLTTNTSLEGEQMLTDNDTFLPHLLHHIDPLRQEYLFTSTSL